MNTLPNGDIIYPQRGPPPKNEPPGYTRDQNNPYLFHMDYDDCIHRKERRFVQPCGRVKRSDWCELKGRVVTPLFCSSCMEIDDGNKSEGN